VEEEHYDNYKLVQSIWTPHSITRYSTEKLRNSASSPRPATTRNCPDSMFEAAVTYDPKVPLKKR